MNDGIEQIEVNDGELTVKLKEKVVVQNENGCPQLAENRHLII